MERQAAEGARRHGFEDTAEGRAATADSRSGEMHDLRKEGMFREMGRGMGPAPPDVTRSSTARWTCMIW